MGVFYESLGFSPPSRPSYNPEEHVRFTKHTPVYPQTMFVLVVFKQVLSRASKNALRSLSSRDERRTVRTHGAREAENSLAARSADVEIPCGQRCNGGDF